MRKRSRKLEEECCCSRVHKLDSKHEENENVGEEDIISHLPEHILHHIFSFVDIKNTIQTTCLLSKRWRYFWVSLPTLNFTNNTGNQKTDFLDFVDRVFMLRDSSNIHGFILFNHSFKCINVNTWITVSCYVTNRLNTWILASVTRNVQELTLDTCFPEKFHFHQCLFTCKSLTKLVVDAKHNRVSLSLPDSVTLPRLKTLYLDLVKFEDEDSTNRLFSSCPILESLTICNGEFAHINVNISSPLLQHLRLSHCRTWCNALDFGRPVLETNFQLCAPNLISFCWSNNKSIHCAPKNFSSLVKADIHTVVYEEKKEMHAPFIVNFFRGLHNVKDLTISAAFLEVIITGAPDLSDSQPTKFDNLRCLKLTGPWRSVDCFHAISYLVGISPNIETLFVEVCCPRDKNKMQLYWNPDEVTSNSAKRGDCWKAVLSLEGLLNHVKCFELCYVTGLINELEFIEILLKNAMLLEELVISLCIPYPYYDKKKELGERRLAKFSEKVLTFPKASSKVVISFKYVG